MLKVTLKYQLASKRMYAQLVGQELTPQALLSTCLKSHRAKHSVLQFLQNAVTLYMSRSSTDRGFIKFSCVITVLSLLSQCRSGSTVLLKQYIANKGNRER